MVIHSKDYLKPRLFLQYCNFKRTDFEFPDIGFAFLPAYQQQGLAHEASYCYLDKIKEAKIWNKIIGITMPENVSSIHLLEKLGFMFAENRYSETQVQVIFELNL